MADMAYCVKCKEKREMKNPHQITMKNGSVEQSNYTDYLVPRIDITPETHVYFVENTHLPGGVGEPGVPPTAPAICNAIYAATGKRIRALPVNPQQLRA